MRANATGLPITLDLDGKIVLVVGLGEEAERKRELLNDAGAEVRASDGFAESLLQDVALVMLTVRDAQLAERIHATCKKRNILVWCCDDPPHSDLAMPAIAKLGAARIAVSTSGASPALAGRLRAALEKSLGERFAKFVELLGALRDRGKQDPDEARRRATLQAAVEGFDVEVNVRYPKWF